MWGAIASGVFSLATGWLENRRAKQKREGELIEQAQSLESMLAIQRLKASGRILRRASFAMWSFPMVWAFVDPAGAAAAFEEALAVLPDWYVKGYLAMTGAIWGLTEWADKIGFKRAGGRRG